MINKKLEEYQELNARYQRKDGQKDVEFDPMNGQAAPVDLPISLMGGIAAKATGKFAKDANKFLKFLMKRGAAHEAEKQEDKLLEKAREMSYDLNNEDLR